MNIILGPPGTGKTTTLLNIMDKRLISGVVANNICFISFTKRAIKEAKSRVKEKFNLTESQMEHFRTLHSFAFRYLGLSKKNLMGKENYQELADLLGIEISGSNTEDMLEGLEADASTIPLGDRLLFLDGVARTSMTDLRVVWERYSKDDIDYNDLDRVRRGLKLYKQQFALLDYTDLLEHFLEQKFTIKLDLLLIDEAQDLSLLQWKVLEKLIANSKEVYVAGDDDQAIFRWAGANIEYFITLEGNVTVLDYSYRLPKEVHSYAKGILKNISIRREKNFRPATHAGSVNYVDEFEQLDLYKGNWLILARSAYTLMSYAKELWNANMFFHFKNRGPDNSSQYRLIAAYLSVLKGIPIGREMSKLLNEYILADILDKKVPWEKALTTVPDAYKYWYKGLEEQGVDLLKPPKIQLSTIHGAKGTECDNVVVCPDLSYKAYTEMMDNPDDEARVFYTAVTRAKENLFILSPSTRYYYEL